MNPSSTDRDQVEDGIDHLSRNRRRVNVICTVDAGKDHLDYRRDADGGPQSDRGLRNSHRKSA